MGSARIWADAPPDVLAATHQIWLRDPATGNYLLDVFREPHDDGIPYLAPELVLLFKAKQARGKDQADFEAAVPHLTPAQRETLSGLLARLHPGHPWLARLGRPVVNHYLDGRLCALPRQSS